MAKPKQFQPDEPKQEEKPAEAKLILSQDEHAKLSEKEKIEFRQKNGTISNQ